MMVRASLRILLLAVLMGVPVLAAAPTVSGETSAPRAGEALGIVARNGRHAFTVEVMRNDDDRGRGLMFRRSMGRDQGMLFDFARVAPVNMWMKNTYIPLDMLFIREDGTIARVAADTEPLSTRVVPSGEPVLAVLELNAGTAAALGIRAGDRVEHPLFRAR